MRNIKRNKLALEKYSNIHLFEERNPPQIKAYKTTCSTNFHRYKFVISKLNKEKYDINQIINSFYEFQNNTAKNDEEKSVSQKKDNNSKKENKTIFYKTSNNFNDTSFPFYITDKTLTEVETKKQIYILPKNRYQINNPKQLKLNLLCFKRNNTTYSTQYLTDIYTNRNNYEITKEFTKTLDFKYQNQKKFFHRNNYNIKDYIQMTKREKEIKFDSIVKKEHIQTNTENKEQKIQELNEKMDTLKKIEVLYNKYYSNKITEYLRFLLSKKVTEKEVNSTLLNQIYVLKREISNLMNRIRKIELQKFSIIQWFIFQIQLKEKELELPIHYIKIIESNIKINNSYRTTFTGTRKNSKLFPKRSKTISVDYNPKSFAAKKEKNRILEYKDKLLFTPDKFMKELKYIENEYLDLFLLNDSMKLDVEESRKEFNNIMKSKLIFESILLNKIRKYEKILNKCKSKYEKSMKLLSELKKKDKKVSKGKKIITKKLLSKVEELFDNCKKIEISKGQSFSLDNRIKNLVLRKSDGSIESDILSMMKYIEIKITKSFNSISLFNNSLNPKYEFILNLKKTLIRKRKIEKAEQARKQQEYNYNKLMERIKNRKDKLLFLPRRKVYINNYALYFSKPKKEGKKKVLDSNLQTFEDIIF